MVGKFFGLVWVAVLITFVTMGPAPFVKMAEFAKGYAEGITTAQMPALASDREFKVSLPLTDKGEVVHTLKQGGQSDHPSPGSSPDASSSSP